MHGGALAMRDSAKMKIYTSTLITNSATRYGGAIYGRDDISLGIYSCLFESNHNVKQEPVSSAGGVIYLQNKASLEALNCSFSFNSAGQGGMIYAYGELVNVLISACRFHNNEAVGWYAGGGAIVADGAHLEVQRCRFDGNRASAGTTKYEGGTCRSVAIMQCAPSLQALCNTDADCKGSASCYACNSVSWGVWCVVLPLG